MSVNNIINTLTSISNNPNEIRNILFDLLHTSRISGNSQNRQTWKPFIDIYENDDNLIIIVDLCGISNESIFIDFFNNKV